MRSTKCPQCRTEVAETVARRFVGLELESSAAVLLRGQTQALLVVRHSASSFVRGTAGGSFVAGAERARGGFFCGQKHGDGEEGARFLEHQERERERGREFVGALRERERE